MRIVDLSMTIRNHWRWKVEQSLHHDFARGDEFQSSIFQMGAHAFTHVDTPLHCTPGAVPLQDLPVDAYSGDAVILDLSFKGPNEAITVEDLTKRQLDIPSNVIILLKTCWDQHYSPYTQEYWTQAPYVTDEAALWLKARKPRVVGFDFPQDYPLKTSGVPLTLDTLTTHKHLLRNEILHIEYLCNMAELTQDRVQLIALPLKLENFEGGPARVIAIEN